MFWHILWSVLWYGPILGGLYIIGALILLSSSTIKKAADGTLIIKRDSWHFRLMKLAHYYSDEREELFLKNGVSICRYYWKLFWTVILGIPVLLFIELIKCIVYTPFTFLFGYYVKPSFVNAFECMRYDDFAAAKFKWTPFIPKLEYKDRKIYLVPGWIVIPTILGAICWLLIKLFLWGVGTSPGFRFLIVVLVVYAAIVGIRNLLKSLRTPVNDGENTKTNLLAEYVRAKKHWLCPIARVQ